MNPTSHRAVTLAAVECLADLEPRNGSTRKRLIISGTNYALLSNKKLLAVANSQTDGHAPEYNGKKYKDYDFRNEMSFIDINGAGTANDNALDDPHVSKAFESPDKCEKSGLGSSFAAYNHFIDIGKGKGTYNDYDGYSYHKGSGSVNEYETLHDAVQYFTGDGFLNGINSLLQLFTKSYKVDEALAWYFNDSNVEYPGSKWYRNCSPALWNYSYPSKTYNNKYNEMTKRFPWGGYGTNAGKRNKGKCVPWSVFMPVDNLGRYWYETFLMSRKVWDLGPVLHAVQDACVPHHAAGHMGNYHAKYEKYLEGYLYDKDNGKGSWSNLTSLRRQAAELFKSYNVMGAKPKSLTYPKGLTAEKPNLSWSVDEIITWAAFNAYYEYVNTYNSFKSFKSAKTLNIASAQKLFVLSLALSMLILKKAQIDAVELPRERKVDKIVIESIELSGDRNILFGITQGSMNSMVGGSIEIGKKRDVPKCIKKGGFVLNVSEYSIDAAYMLLSIKKTHSDKLTVKSLKVSYVTRDGKTHYYCRSLSTAIVLDSMFQKTIPQAVMRDAALPMALGVTYPDAVKDREYVDKIRICLELGKGADAGSSGGLTLLVNSTQNGKDVNNEYPLFKNGLTHGTNVQEVAFALKDKIRPDELRFMKLINKRANAVNIIGYRTQFLDGYSNVICRCCHYSCDLWLEPGKTDNQLIANLYDFQWFDDRKQ